MTTDPPDGPSARLSPDVDFTALQPGRVVGRYEIAAVLGHGGFGITYRARDSQLGRDVAIKEYLPAALAVRQDGTTVLPRSTRTAEDFSWGRQRFVDEGRTLATLQRASAIVRVFDFLEANGTAYIVMELVPGVTLESRLRAGPLEPKDIDRILWPLLDGLEQVHAAGFLHRDIKPANILLDAAGNPTLIDFGAARTAIAGHSAAMTAVFTPGYAAAEQMTSARQGPWTDIYALSATLYHAIVGTAPPSAFDRMLDDSYRPLVALRPEGFAPGLLIGIDAGLAVRANDRPQSIAGWRPLLAQAAAPDATATVVMGRETGSPATVVMRPPPIAVAAPAAPRPKRGVRIALAAALLLAIGGGGYYLVGVPAGREPPASDGGHAPRQAVAPDASQQAAAQAELERLREAEARRKADDEAHLKAEAEAAMRREIEEETRRTLAAEATRKAEEQARLKAEEEEVARRKKAETQADIEAARRGAAEEEAKRTAEADELALQLSVTDRQHVQVALMALGYNPGAIDGVFGAHTRQVIADWQKSRGYPATGRLTGAENQALLREAMPAITRFDEEEKRKATSQAKPSTLPLDAAAPSERPSVSAAATPRSAPDGSGPDGMWQGVMSCSANRNNAPEFTLPIEIMISGGAGTWARPGSGSGTRATQSVSVRVSGDQVTVTRIFVPNNAPGTTAAATMSAQRSGNTIRGAGPEHNGGGRRCEISLKRT